MNIYLVGGSLRDRFLGLNPKDLDYAVEAESFEHMESELIKMGAKIYLSKPEYFTIRAKLNGEDADFVLCRKDGIYKDGRRPDSVEAGTIQEDLARRDLTINSFCQNIETGEIIDPYNGIEHLKQKRLVCVDSVDRLREDSLRMLRALRFSITKGFTIDQSIVDTIQNEWELIKNVSVERISDELNKCFDHCVNSTLQTLIEYRGLFEWVFTHPEIKMKVITKKQ